MAAKNKIVSISRRQSKSLLHRFFRIGIRPSTALAGFAFLGFVCTAPVAFGQYFGKNQVQYKQFKTYFIQSKHFDIYYTDGGKRVAEFTAETAERVYRKLRRQFRYELTDRISIIIYNSHNDFSQTNIQLSPVEESVGGFTEFMKNRVVIPFEGEWEKLRHVVHHELTHALMLQMFYGAGVQSILSGMMQFQLPLWFVEGLAEYQSRGWDTESDMFMRDAVINTYATGTRDLRGYLIYKGGQSIFYFIARKYGWQKVGELVNAVRHTKDLDSAMRQTLGLGIDALSAVWMQALKKEYWPEIGDKSDPWEFATRLTDHRKYGNFINNSPALSPDGSRLAFLSDKSDYFEIYLLDPRSGKIITRLVSGQKSGNLEELHWLRPGIAWSPDGRRIAFAAKAGGADVLHLVDVRRRKIVRSLKFDLDGVFSPAWSPQGEEIAFVGIKNSQSDIYAVNLATGKVRQITDDVFSDLDPAYAPDGRRLAFVSDRGAYFTPGLLAQPVDIAKFDYQNFDIYSIGLRGATDDTLARLTDTPYWERSPVFSPDGSKLAFTCDRNGVFNIYLHRFATGEAYPITNSIAGITQLSWAGDGTALAFTSFSNAGYDVYLLKLPPQAVQDSLKLHDTLFITRLKKRQRQNDRRTKLASRAIEASSLDKYMQYILDASFDEKFGASVFDGIAFLDTNRYKTPDGEYVVRKYKMKLTADILGANAGFDPFYGLQGAGQMVFSDILGNHRLALFADFFRDLRNSNFSLRYFYLPKRPDIGTGLFHYAFYFYSPRRGVIRDRYFGSNLYLSYPLSRFHRLDANLTWIGINRTYMTSSAFPDQRLRVLLLNLAYVKDTSVWGWFGPTNGARSEIRLNYAPQYDRLQGIDFVTLSFDYRRYFKLARGYNLVLRLAGGASVGKHPQLFFVGGIDNWLNPRFSRRLAVDQPEQIYFSTFVTPLRGGDFYEKTGNRFALVNFELRFPMIRSILLRWPFPIALTNIRGALFSDIGSAWYAEQRFQPLARSSTTNRLIFNDVLMGYGFGARAYLGYLLLRFDVAWSTDLERVSPKPKYYFSFGADF